jgi:hypothetical protein
MKDQVVAKLIALKAYLVVKQAAPQEHDVLKDKAAHAVHFLKSQNTLEGLRRRVFYNLVLAELMRDTDPVPYRAAAMDTGERLSELGYVDPTPIYMQIVDATTERLTTAHFGDFKSSPSWSHSSWSHSPVAESQAFHGSIGPVLAAVKLEESVAEDYDKFLQVTSLDEIMKKHGIS